MILKMYFYLEWTEKRPSYITVLTERPKQINYECEVKIDKKDYIICGNINTKFRKYYPPCKLPYSKNQYLLSHLQKSIRRMDDIKSVKTAKQLIDLDIQSFLRRVPILMMEDVTIHESVIVVVWLMISISKGFEIKYEMIKWLLGIIYYLSNEKEKTEYHKNITEKTQWNIEEEEKEKELNTILYSLRFRKCYGGMKGDMDMIEYYIHHILNGDIQWKKDKIPMIKIEMDDLKRKEWIYQANDFHCNRYIISKIKNYYPKMKEDKIKQLIWCFSSSLNKREYIVYDEKLRDEWDKIKKVVRYVQKECRFY